MAIFDSRHDYNTLDWRILRDGGISLYRNTTFLDEDLASLQIEGYAIVRFDCTKWIDSAEMHDALKKGFSFPDFYGRNFDALWDCMNDIEVSDAGGLLIILNRFDILANGSVEDERAATILLNIFAKSSRYNSLLGRRLIAFVQSDDPQLRFDGLGSVSAIWNRREWLNKDRGL